MTPRRFRLKVADHIGTHGTMTEARAIHEVATLLGWIDMGGRKTDSAPAWLDAYRDLVSYRNTNLQQAEMAMERAAVCSEKLEALADAHHER